MAQFQPQNKNNTKTMKANSSEILATANQICSQVELPVLTQEQFDHFYSVPPVFHGVNTQSPSRALEAEWRPRLHAAMKLSILWHEGIEGLAAAVLASEGKADAQFDEWNAALPVIAAAAAKLRSLCH